ncbi:molybdopterin converting factor subunit 1 [Salipaludibacillus sp. HK11]|uniref:molybdopterin converting factor subunit 1 n=1 Tax=Salipaludibacillus sp. HK11 TaxID=3394320 RepID=UPI0039FC3DCE
MIRILLFAELEEAIGQREIELTKTNEQLSVGAIRKILAADYPKLKGISRAMVAVNEEFAEDKQLVHEGDLVAFIPPVSGG